MALKLEEHETKTALWQRLEAHFKEELESARRKNDRQKTELDTAFLRGRIAQLKSFLALGEPPRPGSKSDDEQSPSDW
jgi:hypothetical protein